jgi:hypothetical protein
MKIAAMVRTVRYAVGQVHLFPPSLAHTSDEGMYSKTGGMAWQASESLNCCGQRLKRGKDMRAPTSEEALIEHLSCTCRSGEP